ncbi:MAG TPA: toll/interleukin-1 receptor domain-containing protein [Lacunisphaera sp.]|nr:toll/interleukin-1 receptor domain-containing protein [Lacunisphaera sp.]
MAQPTIFISYASEDREAARRLRDTLQAAGLDVWYDENELGGGDAWDQKIRRQIRECDYFMPVISATTERRKEGYFRREWRLAAERTLDMADDVMFLLPVAIDGTTETNARVPEKFVSVQWLRAPGGQATPAFEALVRRIATGDHHVPPASESSPKAPRLSKAAAAAHHDGPPPMPPFPHVPEKGHLGHGLKFLAEVAWWVITAAWVLLKRSPRWVRIVVSIWFISWGVAHCSRSRDREAAVPAPPGVRALDAKEKEAAKQAAIVAATKLAGIGQDAAKTDPVNAFKEIARGVANGLKDADLSDKRVLAVPFALGVTDAADATFLGDVFTPMYGRLAVALADDTGAVTQPLAGVSNDSLRALGERLDARFVLGAWVTHQDGVATLHVRLMKVEPAGIAWNGDYPVAGSDPAVLAGQIADGVLAVAKP